MKLKRLSLLTVICILAGCTSQQKEDLQDGGTAIKEAGTAVGHAARDATRETGHFFRDIFSGDSEPEDSDEE